MRRLVQVQRRRRHSTLRLLRALWRYRGRIHAHGNAYQAELATAVRTALVERFAGRAALGSYRLAMRGIRALAIVMAITAGAMALALLVVMPWLALLALLPAVAAGVLLWWRFTWGAPLDWLDEHADPARTVTIEELPGRLRELARETRAMVDVPARLADELDALAADVEPAPAT